MDTNTRQLAHLTAQALEKLEAAVLTCLPADKRREVVLSAPWIEFRLALDNLTGKTPRAPLADAARREEDRHKERDEERALIVNMIECMIGDLDLLDSCTGRDGAERIVARIKANRHREG